jgi:hypothetical protein
LKSAVEEAGMVIQSCTAADLESLYPIQGFKVTGIQAILHVVEHFAFHTGQIVYITKMRLEKDLRFTRLPGSKVRKRLARRLPML